MSNVDIMANFVSFITVEDGDDLIVSFALGEHAATSLTLLCTPKYENLLPEEERGVYVGTGYSGGQEKGLLISVQWSPRIVQIESTVKSYTLDITGVEADEIKEAKRVLQKMNYDHCFEIKNV